MKTPCEMIIWDLVPSIRREIARILVEEHSFTQKKVAEIMGVTEAAVSYYLRGRRGMGKKIDDETKELIRKITSSMLLNVNVKKSIPRNMICEICLELRRAVKIYDVPPNAL